MKRVTILGALALLVALVTVAVPAMAVCPSMPVDLEPAADMIAGQHTDVGDIYIWNDDENIYVRYVTIGNPWFIKETHLAIGVIPLTKKGNPIPGQFLYGGDMLWTKDVCYAVPIGEMSGIVPVAAHAVVNAPCLCLEETAWGMFWCDGDQEFVRPLPGANWATYFAYEIQQVDT